MSITLIIVVFTSLISLWAFNNPNVFSKLKHVPAIEQKNGEYYRMLTSGFLHGDYIHLFLNMFVLHEFGRFVESYVINLFGDLPGKIIFLVTYLVMIILADLPTFIKHKENPYFASVGASGAVSGIVFMYILLKPWAMLGLFAIIPIPAIIFGVLYLWYSSWASKNSHDLVDHDAHFYGAIAGISILIALQPSIIRIFFDNLIQGFPY
ncbi:MAG: rhomboid family intramembrane serine protease [Saprospiraceae bacterium]